MDDMNAFERQLAGAMEHRAGPPKLVDDGAIFEAIGATTRPSRWSFQSLFGATRFAVAVAIVALFGGFLLVGLLMQPGDERTPAADASATPRASIGEGFDLPTELPDDVRGGAIDTPSGPVRWVHVSSSDYALPGPGELIPWPSGLALFSSPAFGCCDGPDEAFARPADLWLSDDGIRWRKADLPVAEDAHGASLSYVDGTYWLVSSLEQGEPQVRASRIWTSTDGAAWQEVDTTDIPRVGPLGMRFDGGPGMAVTSGDHTLIDVHYTSTLGELFGLAEDLVDGCGHSEGFFPIEGEVGYLCGQPALRFIETEAGVQALEFDGAAMFLDIPGATLADLAQLGWDEERESFEPEEERLLMVEGGRARLVDRPRWWEGAAVLGGDRGFYAIGRDWNESGMQTHAWRSDDGISWREVSAPDFADDGSTHDYMNVTPGHILASGPDLQAWETFDGVDWSPAPGDRPACEPPTCAEDGPSQLSAVRLGSGWFANDPSWGGWADGDVLWIHAGGKWVSLAGLGMERPLDADGAVVRKTGIGNTTLFRAPGAGLTATDLWVLDFDTPADR